MRPHSQISPTAVAHFVVVRTQINFAAEWDLSSSTDDHNESGEHALSRTGEKRCESRPSVPPPCGLDNRPGGPMSGYPSPYGVLQGIPFAKSCRQNPISLRRCRRASPFVHWKCHSRIHHTAPVLANTARKVLRRMTTSPIRDQFST